MNGPMKFHVLELRPEVLAFALMMEARLREKDADKGDSWRDLSAYQLSTHALSSALRLADDVVPENRVKRAVNVANYCMMIAGVGGALDIAAELDGGVIAGSNRTTGGAIGQP